MGQPEHVVIVGAGQAGFQAAASLRDEGFSGAITLVGDEPTLPYQRPPLSKAFMLGKADEATLMLRSEAFYDDRSITMLMGVCAVALDRAAHTLTLSDGRALTYDHLVLALGARNRPLPVPGADLDGVFQLRTLADARAIRERMADAQRAVVVGAGFIGLEFAAVASAQGLAVTVIEAADRPMARPISRDMGDFFRRSHESAGVAFLFDAGVARLVGEAGHVTGVETADGAMLAADLVLIGIGVIPNTELAEAAGLMVANGVLVDADLLTGDPAISAVGDCAAFPSRFSDGGIVRIESVQNGVDQARAVAARLAGRPAPYGAVPWFWSDQGKLKLQIAGLVTPHETAVVRGDPASGAFSVFCFRDDRLVGVESVNRPADHMVARRLLAQGTPLSEAEAADLSVDLKARAAATPATLPCASTAAASIPSTCSK